MHSSNQISFIFLLVGILTSEFSYALRDVRVKVPHAVRRGDKAVLKCFYDIEDDTLYSVKWYKGRREFYRYTPKENPPMKIFQFLGVKVEPFSSNESQLVLESVTMATSGKYSCEVSADAPSFHTLIAAGELEVVEVPHNAPLITGIRPRYRIGDILRGNCTSRHSRPAAKLSWMLNNEELNPAYIRHHRILREVRSDLETAVSTIRFIVNAEHFENGKLKLRCTAQIQDIYRKSTEKTIIEAEHHHKYTSINSVNMVQPEEPYDQYALHDGEAMQHKRGGLLTQLYDLFLHLVHVDEDAEDSIRSSSSSSSATNLLRETHLPTLLTILLFLCWAFGSVHIHVLPSLALVMASKCPGRWGNSDGVVIVNINSNSNNKNNNNNINYNYNSTIIIKSSDKRHNRVYSLSLTQQGQKQEKQPLQLQEQHCPARISVNVRLMGQQKQSVLAT